MKHQTKSVIQSRRRAVGSVILFLLCLLPFTAFAQTGGDNSSVATSTPLPPSQRDTNRLAPALKVQPMRSDFWINRDQPEMLRERLGQLQQHRQPRITPRQTAAVDLVITKTVVPSIAAPGETVTYTIELSYIGLVPATGIVLTDIVPAELTILNLDFSGIVITNSLPNGGLINVWEVSDMGSGDMGIITLTAVVDPNTTANNTFFDNTVHVSTVIPEDDLSNNESYATLYVTVPSANVDVWLTKTVFPEVVSPGDWVTYTLEFGNSGLDVATGVSIYDAMPTELINGSYDGSGASIINFANDTWYLDDLLPGRGGIITLMGQVSPTLSSPTSFDNRAYIATLANDIDGTNNVSSATVTVTDLPIVSFSALSYEVGEGDGEAVITVTLSQPAASDVVVDYLTLNDTALHGTDYDLTRGTLTFIPGQIEQRFIVRISEDTAIEGPETLYLHLTSQVGAVLGVDLASLTILDNETANILLNPMRLEVTEGQARPSYEVSLSAMPSAVVTVTLKSVYDEVETMPQALIFTSDNWDMPQTVAVNAIDDTVVEPIENDLISHEVVSDDPMYAALPDVKLDVTVYDNDFPTVSFGPPIYQEVAEDNGDIYLTIQLSQAALVTATVDYTITGLTTNTIRYGTATFTPSTGQVAFVRVPIVSNEVFDGNKIVNIVLSNPTNSTLANPTVAQLLIVDNETAPTVTLTLPDGGYVTPDYGTKLGQFNWRPITHENFEGTFPPDSFQFFDQSDDNLERSWGQVELPNGAGTLNKLLWPAAEGQNRVSFREGYPTNLYSVLEYGPLDLSSQSDALVGFGLWHDIDVNSEDGLIFCASAEDPNTFACSDQYWTGQSEGWNTQAMGLKNYAGYNQVWLYWIFVSDDVQTEAHAGPFLDEIQVWGLGFDAPPPSTLLVDPKGSLLVNGNFESGMDRWDVKQDVAGRAITLSGDRAFEGQSSARMAGTQADFLYQTMMIPDKVWNLDVSFWYTLDSQATEPNQDWFCASIRETGNWDNFLVDLGCFDAFYASDFRDNYWQEALVSLLPDEVMQLRNKQIDLVFELYNQHNTGEKGTAIYLDKTHLYVSGGEGAAYLDANEFNDIPDKATLLTCGQTITGVIGNALGGYDEDWFVLNNLPPGQLVLDLDAQTLLTPSTLDSVMSLYDHKPDVMSQEMPTVYNDDDGNTADSYLTHTVTSGAGPFYLSVADINGFAEANADYELTVQCAVKTTSQQSTFVAPVDQTTPMSWTLMLYLNAEDKNFEQILTKYRTDLEAMIGSKQNFLNIVVLYDGPSNGTMGNSGTTRYLIQPNGVYTNGENRWSMGELNLGDPRTLSDFVSWGMDRYPAAHYFLAIDDHGDGAYGISQDSTSNDLMTPPELYGALKQATQNGQRKIDIIDFEACLMGLAENAYDMKDFANYLVFFEQISWGIDTYPQYFRDLQANDDPLTVAKRIVSRYHEGANVANDGRGYPHTISLIDLSKMDGLGLAVDALGKQLLTRLAGSTTITDINNLRNVSQAFANSSEATNPRHADYIDLWDLADKLNQANIAPAEALAVRKAGVAAVIAEYKSSGKVDGITWDHRNAHGLSIYYPTSQFSSAFFAYPDRRMSQDTSWDGFLDKVVPLEIGEGKAPGGDSDGRGQSSRGQSSRGQSSRGQSSRAQEKFTSADTGTFIFKNSSTTYLPLIVK